MFVMIEGAAEKRTAQAAMERVLKTSLKKQGVRNIGFPSGNVDELLYSNGPNQLWCVFGESRDAAVPRRWNAFGVFDPNLHAQHITVEINIPTKNNSARVAGFFAREIKSGHVSPSILFRNPVD